LYNNSANTKFIGKSIHFLPSCHSTNEVAQALIRSEEVVNGLTVITNNQTAGKGQHGNTWYSSANLNLTFSVIIFPKSLLVSESFLLNIISSLAIADTLEAFLENDKKICVKWPNDVYIGHKKASGILIENTLRGNNIHSIVMGIGLNVNQSRFEIPTATSLFAENRKTQELQEVLNTLLEQLEYYYDLMVLRSKNALFDLYKKRLFGLNEENSFRDEEGLFTGVIRDVEENGCLIIEKESGIKKGYQFKEVQFEIKKRV
jgi:BirA family biotin operon repressor/biotin-[acetyl-CoA-carboxylase] ligase